MLNDKISCFRTKVRYNQRGAALWWLTGGRWTWKSIGESSHLLGQFLNLCALWSRNVTNKCTSQRRDMIDNLQTQPRPEFEIMILFLLPGWFSFKCKEVVKIYLILKYCLVNFLFKAKVSVASYMCLNFANEDTYSWPWICYWFRCLTSQMFGLRLFI